MGEIGQAVALLDLLLDAAVLRVAAVVEVGEAPLVDREVGAGLEHALDALEEGDAVGRVAGGLDAVGGVVAVRLEGQVHEVRHDELAAVGEPGLLGELAAAADLVVVGVDAGDLGAGVLGDVAHRAADAAAEVHGLHARVEAQLAGEEALVALERVAELLVLEARREVEAVAPAELVEVGDQVVVLVHQRAVGALALVAAGLAVVVELAVVLDGVGEGVAGESGHESSLGWWESVRSRGSLSSPVSRARQRS